VSPQTVALPQKTQQIGQSIDPLRRGLGHSLQAQATALPLPLRAQLQSKYGADEAQLIPALS